jgi:glycerate kinase
MPDIAVGGRSTLERDDQERVGLAAVYTLADRSAMNTAHDPELLRVLLTGIGCEIGIASRLHESQTVAQ